MMRRGTGHALLLAAALGAVGCGDDDGSNPIDSGMADAGPLPDGGETVDPRVMACRETIAAREAAVASMLPSWSIEDAAEMVRTGGDQAREADYAGRYRDDLASHPGCMPRASYGNNVEFLVTDNQATVPAGAAASIDGYPCAAKEYEQPAEDATKPIVILVHGNSSSVTTFEEYANSDLAGDTITNVAGFEIVVESEARPQLATRLLDAGYRVISFDARTDLVNTLADYDATTATGNAFRNIDHGWAVPMLQALVRAVLTENPTRRISLVGHSLGVSVIRDALRRLYLEHRAGEEGAVNPFARIQDVVLLSGSNHGVSAGQVLCDTFEHMRGTVGCEMGDRGTFVPTYFTRPLNGPNDLFAAPCADGSYAYGERDQCDGNVVEYTTITMEDIPSGELQDEFVSETSSQLDLENCVDNELITLSDYDRSGYFFTGAPGFFANHFGSARSPAGIDLILEKLAD